MAMLGTPTPVSRVNWWNSPHRANSSPSSQSIRAKERRLDSLCTSRAIRFALLPWMMPRMYSTFGIFLEVFPRSRRHPDNPFVLRRVDFGACNLHKKPQMLVGRITARDQRLPIQRYSHGFTEARLTHTPRARPNQRRGVEERG